MDDPPNLSIAGGQAEGSGLLADFITSRLKPAAMTYWTAIQPNLPVTWNDAFSKSLGMLCELLAERDELNEAIERSSDEETGLMLGQKGELRRHPLATRMTNVEGQIFDVMKQFGMTPAGLKRLSGLNGDKDEGSSSLMSLIG